MCDATYFFLYFVILKKFGRTTFFELVVFSFVYPQSLIFFWGGGAGEVLPTIILFSTISKSIVCNESYVRCMKAMC